MSNPVEKYAVLIDALLAKTKSGDVPWDIENGRSISVESTSTTLKLSESTDENFEKLYTIEMYKHDGAFIDGFNDTVLTELNLSSGSKSYFLRMEELYNLGRRQATGADKAIDDFLGELDAGKLGVPF